MSGTFRFELVSPERILLSDTAEEVIVPGVEGEFTVLAGHAPVVSAILPGVIHAKLMASTKGIYVDGGFVVRPGDPPVNGARSRLVQPARGFP